MTKTVSLVLGSGGARGNAHIGVIEELLERNYKIISIAGCSMGALVGGVFAAGKLDAYKEWATSRSYFDILRLVDLSFDAFGLIQGDKVFTIIRELVGPCQIEELPLSYTAVATDLTNQKEVWFQEGDLFEAMRASIAIPSLFSPVVKGDRILVDGGLLNPVPIIPTVSDHADIIIAVNLSAPPVTRGGEEAELPSHTDQAGFMDEWNAETAIGKTNGGRDNANGKEEKQDRASEPLSKRHQKRKNQIGRLEMIYQSVEVMQSHLTQYKIAGYPPDVLIEIPKSSCRFFEFYRAQEMVDIGRETAKHVLDHYEHNQRILVR
ncbi:MAG: patatin-like phospholipase family protein [Motiliproteus sp.]|nr:patatin-like phospholipase family protein [Motiliproteus sp.]MCW9051117.1 patatin-like phospholipase family protein [Motiliproteus sp.]